MNEEWHNFPILVGDGDGNAVHCNWRPLCVFSLPREGSEKEMKEGAGH
jgi:hypothetical protein